MKKHKPIIRRFDSSSMKEVEPTLINGDNLSNLIGQKITQYLDGLDPYKNADRQKQLELCQIGKFLATFFPTYNIKQVREEPDFIITNGQIQFGLEHQVIMDQAIKKQQGFYENIFKIVERDIQSDNELPNFLAYCYLKPNLSFKMKDKTKLIQLIKQVVLGSVLNNEIPENPIIDRILQLPHKRKSIGVNFGAHVVHNLTENIVYDFIKKKEEKIEKYTHNTGLNQWLVLLAGGEKEYSYSVIESLCFDNIDTKFQRIFLMDDFDNKLYRIK